MIDLPINIFHAVGLLCLILMILCATAAGFAITWFVIRDLWRG